MSHRNHRRQHRPQIRPIQRLRHMKAADAAPEDHRGKAIGRAKWKRLTSRAARHAAAREVAAEVPDAAHE